MLDGRAVDYYECEINNSRGEMSILFASRLILALLMLLLLQGTTRFISPLWQYNNDARKKKKLPACQSFLFYHEVFQEITTLSAQNRQIAELDDDEHLQPFQSKIDLRL